MVAGTGGLRSRALANDLVKRFACIASGGRSRAFLVFKERQTESSLLAELSAECVWQPSKVGEWERIQNDYSRVQGWEIVREEVRTNAAKTDAPLDLLLHAVREKRRSAIRKPTVRSSSSRGRRADGSAVGSKQYSLQYNSDGTVKSMKRYAG